MKVLFIEDQENFAYLVKETLGSIRDMPVSFEWVENLERGIARAIEWTPDIILLDLSLPDSDGLDTFNRLHQHAGITPIILLTGTDDEALAIEAIGQGAQDYLLKGEFNRRTLVRAMRYAVERKKSDLRLEHQRQRQAALHDINVAITSTLDLPTIINHLLDNIARLLPETATILSVIDTDTGCLEPVAWRNVNENAWRGNGPHVSKVMARVFAAEPIVIEDCRFDTRMRSSEFIALHEFISSIGVPLRVHNQLLGTLGIFSKQAHAFNGEEIDFFKALGNLAAMAIHNARLYSAMDKKSKKLAALFSVAAAANQSLETEHFLEEVIRKITEIFGFDAMRVCLFDVRGETLQVRAIYQRHPGVTTVSQTFHKGQGITGTVGATGEAMIISNLDSDPRYRELSHSQSAAKAGKKFLAGFPIKYQDQTLGVIVCVGQSPRELADDEIQLITSMSNQIGVAVRNARLYAEVEQKTEELRALFDVTAAAGQSLDARQILGEVAQKITEIFDFDATRVFLFDEPKEQLHAAASFAANAEFTDGPRSFKKGQGITGTAGVTGETLIVSDFHSAAVSKILPRGFSTRDVSHAHDFLGAFPIKYKEDTLGVITCVGRTTRQLSMHEVLLITAMARQIAIAIHNARLYTEVERQTNALSALFEVTAAASQSLETAQILQHVVKKITEIFVFDSAQVLLFDENKKELRAAAIYAPSPNAATALSILEKGTGISRVVAATGEATILGNIDTDPRYTQSPHAGLTQKNQQKFLAAFPIKYHDEIFGVISCSARQPRQLAPHEIQLIDSMSNQIAGALQNARYYEQSKKQAAQLRNYALRQETVLERERTRISREIHDELGQSLTALKLDLSLASSKIDNDTSAFKARLGEMTGLLDATIHNVRKIATQLRPDILDKLGLIPAIEWQLQDFRRRTGIGSRFVSNLTDLQLSDEQATTLFRILQESLTNVARHARAKQVIGFLELRNDQINLRVEDNGVGIAPDKIVDLNSLGLLGMQERAAALGGSVAVFRRRPRGTTVSVTLPLQSSALRAQTLEMYRETR